MTKNDVLLLLSHGALSGMCARPPISGLDTIGKQAVDAARYALAELQATGFTFSDEGEVAAAPAPTVTSTVVNGYNANLAPNPSLATAMAHRDLDVDNEEIVKDFQQAAGLVVDGKVGPKTHAAYDYWSQVSA